VAAEGAGGGAGRVEEDGIELAIRVPRQGVGLDELGIEPLMFEHTFWCNECEGLASNKTCPHDQDARLFLSGTKVREMLGNGERPPHEFSRDEVADILIDAYKED